MRDKNYLSVSNNQTGKEAEAPKEEIEEEKKTKPNNAARFKGLLTSEEADKYHAHLKQARKEWDRYF